MTTTISPPKISLLRWTERYRIIKDKETGAFAPFKFTHYPWLRPIYQDIGFLSPGLRIAWRKAAQMGITELAINLAFYAIDVYGAVVFYALPPPYTAVGDFAHERISPAIANSPRIGEQATEIDNVGLKTFRRGALYLRSANVPPGRPDKAAQLSSVPADVAVIDEYDRVPVGAPPLIHSRLGDSRLKVEILLSTPTFPGIGIDAEYQNSTRHEPQIKCQDCGRWHWLDWSLVAERGGRAGVWCPTCKAEIDRLNAWAEKRMALVPHNPQAQTRGYWTPKLVSPRADLTEMWERSRSVQISQVLAFWNDDMGLPYEPKGARLSLELLRACVDDFEMPDRADGCAMGVDVGYVLNVWIMQPQENGRHKAVFIGEVLEWEDLDRLMARYGVLVCVVDDAPELTADIAFARRHRGRVFLANYVEEIDGSQWVRYNFERQQVTIDRTTGLDVAHKNIETMIDSLPRDMELIPNFTQQMTVNFRDQVIAADGTLRYVYPKTGKPDHFDHAKVYCEAAMERLLVLRAAGQKPRRASNPKAGEERYRRGIGGPPIGL